MSLETLNKLKIKLEKTVPLREGIEDLLLFLGYSLTPQKKQLLDSDVLFQQKDMRERIAKSYRLFSEKAQWVHPVSKQTFDMDAATSSHAQA